MDGDMDKVVEDAELRRDGTRPLFEALDVGLGGERHDGGCIGRLVGDDDGGTGGDPGGCEDAEGTFCFATKSFCDAVPQRTPVAVTTQLLLLTQTMASGLRSTVFVCASDAMVEKVVHPTLLAVLHPTDFLAAFPFPAS